MFNDIENPTATEESPNSTVTQSEVFTLGPKDPNWEENLKNAVRRDFKDKFNPYSLGDLEAAQEYYKKYRHLF